MTTAQKRKIGLLGGTFDPPHHGHLQAASAAKAQVGLDEVWFVVAHDPWQKSSMRTVTPAPTRLALVQAAIDGCDGFVADDREIRRGGPTYTADTLAEICDQHRDVELFLIVGQDTAQLIGSTWHHPEDVFALSTLIVVTRRGDSFDSSRVPSQSIMVEMTPVDVSSSDIRNAVREERSIDSFTTPGVRALIESLGLYRGAL